MIHIKFSNFFLNKKATNIFSSYVNFQLLNTSFNIHGHPLVNSEKDAIKVFTESNLDALILGNFLIIKKNN